MRTSPKSEIRNPKGSGAFTMIEIAISLAIIGFALVAILGILPFGMGVQKDNRQETIINQDMTVWMNAIRNGERGLDDLTNYVIGITNVIDAYNFRGVRTARSTYGYGPLGSSVGNAPGNPQYPLTNGFRIIGLMSTPKMVTTYDQNGAPNGFLSNHVVAFVRAFSGPASEKAPQNNATVQDLGLQYRLISGVSAYGANFFDPTWTNYLAFPTNNPEYWVRSNYMTLVRTFQANWHEIRLNFRWPLLANGEARPNSQVFRTMVGGSMTATNEYGFPAAPGYMLYYIQPRTYAKAP